MPMQVGRLVVPGDDGIVGAEVHLRSEALSPEHLTTPWASSTQDAEVVEPFTASESVDTALLPSINWT